MKDLIIKLFLGTLTEAEKTALRALFLKFKENNPNEDYIELLKTGHGFLKLMDKVTKLTKTTADDAFVEADLALIEELGAEAGITF